MTQRSAGRWLPGRDARAVRHPGQSGALPGNGSAKVVVAGGGIAGMAAAAGLAERGVAVTLVERHAQLGGRVRSWPVTHDGDAVTMSRGFHAFFRQYYNLRALLRRADPELNRLIPLTDYPLVLAGGPTDSFAKIPRTPPLNLISFVARSPSFPLSGLARVNVPAALELLDVDFPGTYSRYDGESAAQFLDRLRFPDGARHLALEVFARSFFAHPEDFSAGELVAMFHAYFVGSSEGLLFDVPDDDYDTALWAPLRAYLEKLGVKVRTGETVEAITLSAATGPSSVDRGVVVALGGGEVLAADAVVLATDPATTRRLVDGAVGLGEDSWRARVAGGTNAPPFAVWRLWLDRPMRADRPPFLGTSGFGPLDNVSLLERFEVGAAKWSAHRCSAGATEQRRIGGSVVELHAYAAPGLDDEAGLRSRLRTELARVYPESAAAQVLAEEWLVQEDCPLADTRPWALRPEVVTPDARVVLAGDGIRCDLPVALMERAATTGFLAANTLLARFGLAGHDLWSVPMRGRHAAARLAHWALPG